MAACLLSWTYVFGYQKPMYRASSRIYVINTDTSINMANLQLGSYMMDDYKEVFEIWEVHDEVRRNLDLPYGYGQLRSMLKVTNPPGTRMLVITASSRVPEEAANIANEYAQVVSNYIADTMKMDKPTLMSVALVPVSPYNWHGLWSWILAAVIGVLVGAVVVFFMMLMDDKIRTAEDIRRYTGWTTLAVLPENENLEKHGTKSTEREKRREDHA